MLDVAQQEALVAGIRATDPRAAQQLRAAGRRRWRVLVGRPPEAIAVRTGTLTTLPMPEVGAGLPSDCWRGGRTWRRPRRNLVAPERQYPRRPRRLLPDRLADRLGRLGEPRAVHACSRRRPVLLNAAANVGADDLRQRPPGRPVRAEAAATTNCWPTTARPTVQAFTDVENALTAWRYATEQERLEREAVAIAQRAADIARAQLLAGTLDIVTALQTQTTLFSDLDMLVQVRLARFQALVDLYKALGGGWTRGMMCWRRPRPIFNGVL